MAILIFETKILDQYHHLTWARVNYNFSLCTFYFFSKSDHKTLSYGHFNI